MRKAPFFALILTCAAAPALIHAATILLARQTVSGSSTDLSGLTQPLENGVAGNLLGGFGSGLAYAGGGTFLALPDRGPNAVSYNSQIDDTVSYIDRVQTFQMTLTPSNGSRPFTLTPTLTATTLLSSPTPLSNGGNYFTGKSDGFSPSGTSLNPLNSRLDPESIRVSNDGRSVFTSDEYGPYIRQFDRATGQQIKNLALPSYYGVPNQSPQGNTEISGNTQGRLANKGMEGLAISPDGKTLIGSMQSPLIQDGGANSKNIRIVTMDIATGTVTHEYVYQLQDVNNTVSDIVAINDHEFLVDERDRKSGLSAQVKQFYKIDLSTATDVKGLATLPANFTAVSKGSSPLIDMLDPKYGLKDANFPQKIEGLAFGDDVVSNGVLYHTLWVGHDNDFDPTAPSNLFVFGIAATDLPDFQAQVITPEPASFALGFAGLTVVGFAVRKRKAIR